MVWIWAHLQTHWVVNCSNSSMWICIQAISWYISLQTSEAWKVVLVSSTARRKWKVGTRNHLQSHTLYLFSSYGSFSKHDIGFSLDWQGMSSCITHPEPTILDNCWQFLRQVIFLYLVYISFNMPVLCFTCKTYVYYNIDYFIPLPSLFSTFSI